MIKADKWQLSVGSERASLSRGRRAVTQRKRRSRQRKWLCKGPEVGTVEDLATFWLW